MNIGELQRLGLNKNEAIVYSGLIIKKSATAAELVRLLGIHRNIVYDNLEKLISKGFASYVVEESRKKFIAEDPKVILEFLEDKKKEIDRELELAKKMIPKINSILAKNKNNNEATIYRGISGIKKIFLDVLDSKEYWVIGLNENSVDLLGESFWYNFNLKSRLKKIKENLLLNSNFEADVNLKQSRVSKHRILPSELIQVTEIVMYENKVAIIVYGDEPIVILIESLDVFSSFRKQFDFLWKLSKDKK